MQPTSTHNCCENQPNNWIGQGKPSRACQEGQGGPIEKPRGAQGRAKEEPRGGQEWASRVQGGAKEAQRGAEDDPRGPKGVPREPKEMAWRGQEDQVAPKIAYPTSAGLPLPKSSKEPER